MFIMEENGMAKCPKCGAEVASKKAFRTVLSKRKI